MREWLFEHLSMAALEALFLVVGLLALVYVSYSLPEGLAELSHPAVRRLGWRRSLLLLPVSLIPFWNTALGFLLIPAVFAVAAFQVERLWLVQAAGSEAYLAFLRQAALRSSPRAAVLCNLGSAFLVAACRRSVASQPQSGRGLGVLVRPWPWHVRSNQWLRAESGGRARIQVAATPRCRLTRACSRQAGVGRGSARAPSSSRPS
jgi:hypothetical protein